MSGQILGDRYEVERQLGKEAGRWTLLARDLQTQDRVVVKLLFLDESLGTEDLKLFDREVKILRTLSHPCIPAYLDYFEHDLLSSKAMALVQTYVPGKSLQDVMNSGRTLTETEAKQFATVLLKILIYLHEQTPPIIHRDIKPSNIVVGSDRRPYLVDFGSVKTRLTQQETGGYTMVGTYGYMPPEQFSGRAVISSDLYSLGATLIAMMAGKPSAELPRRGTQFDLPKILDLSPAFADWLHWVTEISVEKRLRSSSEALKVLESGQARGAM
jgi:eukaryotic-like serine/threonine-protein kinase